MLSTVRFQSNPCHPWYVFRQTPCVIHDTFLVKLPVSSTVRFQSNFLCHRRYVSSQTPHVIHSTVPVILPMSSTVRFRTGYNTGRRYILPSEQNGWPFVKVDGGNFIDSLGHSDFYLYTETKSFQIRWPLLRRSLTQSHTFFFSFLSFVGDRCVTGELWYLCWCLEGRE